MFAIDTNLLVYAYNMASEFHERAAKVYQSGLYYKNPPVRLAPLGWRAGLNPPLQKGEAVGMPGLIEMLLKSGEAALY